MHDLPIARPLHENRFLCGLLVLYAGVFLLAAIRPHDRSDWLLENLLIFALVGLLAAVHRRFVLSNLSHLLLFVFLCLHALGSHYTYSLVPAGFWLEETFGLSRNPYDRIVHFGFGLLLVYPLRELTRRVVHTHGPWSYVVPLLAVLSLSASYEMIEAWTARVVDPELGIAFVGAQGDEWDAQKDMALALSGALLALALVGIYRARTGREPWRLLGAR